MQLPVSQQRPRDLDSNDASPRSNVMTAIVQLIFTDRQSQIPSRVPRNDAAGAHYMTAQRRDFRLPQMHAPNWGAVS